MSSPSTLSKCLGTHSAEGIIVKELVPTSIGFAILLDNVLSPAECTAMIDYSEQLQNG
jgi:hypothetical protein